MADYYFERECRTPYSEAYIITKNEESIGRVDIHFTSSAAHATLCVTENVDGEGIHNLIETIDEELVMSADVYRDDFIVTVYQGREIGIYSDEEDSEEDEINN